MGKYEFIINKKGDPDVSRKLHKWIWAIFIRINSGSIGASVATAHNPNADAVTEINVQTIMQIKIPTDANNTRLLHPTYQHVLKTLRKVVHWHLEQLQYRAKRTLGWLRN